MTTTTATTTDKNVKYLQYTSDSVEFYPGDNNIFTVGTYEIEQGDTEYKERRKGRLYLYEINEDTSNDENQSIMNEIQTIDFNSGILDMKWNKSNNSLGVVMSKGELNIYDFNNQDKKLKLKSSNDISMSNDILSLSLDWNLQGNKMVCSFSDGKIGLFNIGDGSTVELQSRWKAHDFEAWICAFNYHNESVLFSGGDDCKFKIWDTRLLSVADDDNGDQGNKEVTGTPTITKKCDMGVTSIHCHPSIENIVAVGSYDECLRIWDLRSMKQPLITTDSLGGGIWRIKWHPFKSNSLITACMGGGFHKLESTTSNDFSDLSIVESYNGPHASIAYGVDWSYSNSSDIKQYVGCCSFYDKCLSIWTPNI